MRFTVLTLFPELFAPFWDHSIIRRAIESGIITGSAVNIRDFAVGRHQVTDDRPYGGGCGMVMKPEPLAAAIRAAKDRCPGAETVLLSPQGKVFDQPLAEALAQGEGLILVCGRYEGIDERVGSLVDAEVSIGDYVLTGGEVAAMVIMDAVTRLLPGALGGADSAEKDSFADHRLEHAQYTRPPIFEGQPVPEVLLSGDHGAIARWRRESALIRTLLKRPDLLRQRPLESEESRILKRWLVEIQDLVTSEHLPGAGSLPGGESGR
ncbi:MAG: tRNA (guanosine(37)-N1)-methyltransferase TrmD [Desulfobacterales bacterium]|jgi:tRNA (guanine37-N1)-methyltransferase|nr:tRNA (guanosine(37)-N1)-methyltransferase TrmD [Desulfobacteraceae bacterium]MDD3991029.1 tRNA (guanosine(37)-N1)-methyltransferase TrmD [Desulfobacteraceae bacterium]MDY0311845.1 tRNA (guanosine(37)-N1)-methyltransferase TrmD [Desulfobacterales bacterium]